MPAFPNDEPHDDQSHGDLLVQVCASTPEGCNHALRRVMRVTRDALTLRWMLPGFQEPNTLGPGRASQRNLMGFKDGTANLDAGDEPTMDELVWVSARRRRARRGRSTARTWSRDASACASSSGIAPRCTRKRRSSAASRTPARRSTACTRPMCPRTRPIPKARARRSPRTSGSRTHARTRPRRTASSGAASTSRRASRPTASSTKGLLFVCFQRSLADGFLAVQATARRRSPRGVHQARRRWLLLRVAGCDFERRLPRGDAALVGAHGHVRFPLDTRPVRATISVILTR